MQTIATAPKPERLLDLSVVLSRIPVSRSTWYQGLATGRFPAGVKLGPKRIAWRESDIDALIERLAAGQEG